MALWQGRRPPDTAQHPLLLGPLVPTHKCLSGLPCPLKPLLPDHSPAGQQWASDQTWVDVSLPQDSSEMGADHGPLSQKGWGPSSLLCGGWAGRSKDRKTATTAFNTLGPEVTEPLLSPGAARASATPAAAAPGTATARLRGERDAVLDGLRAWDVSDLVPGAAATVTQWVWGRREPNFPVCFSCS